VVEREQHAVEMLDVCRRTLAALVAGRAVAAAFGSAHTDQALRDLERIDGPGNLEELARAYRSIGAAPRKACELAEGFREAHHA
jgi:hypothetical protein